MIQFTRDTAARWLRALLHIEDTPRRTAAAYAIGVFCGFSPLLGLHTLMGLGLAFAFRLNRVAVVAGVYSNLPWIIAPYYALATAVGALMLGRVPPPDVRAQLAGMLDHSPLAADFWRSATALKTLFWPFMLGSTIGALLLGFVAYRVTLRFLLLRQTLASRTADSR
jgi:uncharacterized protein (DUF2062 family)